MRSQFARMLADLLKQSCLRLMFVLHFSLLNAVKCFTRAIKRSFEFFNKVRIILIAIYYMMLFYCRITVLHEQLRVLGFADATMTALSLTTLNITCSNFSWIFFLIFSFPCMYLYSMAPNNFALECRERS